MVTRSIVTGGYGLESLLARGGLSEVWLARTPDGGEVALKKPIEGMGPAAREALRQEARVGSRLNHPGIVRMLDSGVEETSPWIAFEYIKGPSLRERLATGPLPEEEATEMAIRLLEALAYAHERGVVHMDLKPENILLDSAGPKIADFGSAQSFTETVTTDRARELTATIAYLAPEVLEGAEPSPASDTYALGLTVYEAVAGRLPFTGGAALAAGQRITGGVPRLRQFAPMASPRLERTLATALEPDPGLRFGDAAAFAASLRQEYQPTVVLARPRRGGRKPPKRLAAAGPTGEARRSTASVVAAGMGALMLVGGALAVAANTGESGRPAASEPAFDANARLLLNASPRTPAPQTPPEQPPAGAPPPADAGPGRRSEGPREEGAGRGEENEKDEGGGKAKEKKEKQDD